MNPAGTNAPRDPVRDLGDGVLMPMLGLGVWQIRQGRDAEQAVEWALEAGYRHIDTATAYRNERSVGVALRHSGLARDEMFITTKWMPLQPNPARELARSLERLGLDYVDLYLIHWPTALPSQPATPRRSGTTRILALLTNCLLPTTSTMTR